MKNIKFIFAALVSLAALSCGKLESPVENPDAGLMTLVLSTGEQTKTHISNVTTNGVTEIHWDEGDQIRVFTDVEYKGVTNNDNYDGNATTFRMNGDPNGNFARFGGNIPAKSTKFWAVYPTSSGKSCSTDGNGSDIVASIPSSQGALANSFDYNLNVSVAKGEIKNVNNGTLGYGDYELTEPIYVNFKNVCSLLKFTAPADASQIESVVITADKAIVGDLTINYSGENPQVTGVSGGNSITMNGQFTANTAYYFVLAPVAISDLSIYVNTRDNKQYSATRTFGNDSPLQLKPGQYKSLGTLNYNNMPSFSVDFDIQDEDGFLSGTDVIFTFPSNNITDVQLTISQIDGNASRTIKVSDPDIDSEGRFVSSCSNDTSWPYLPKGKYTIEGSYKTPAGSVSVSGVQLIIDENPNFTVGSFEAKTSYTVYKSGADNAVALANQFDGTKIEVTASDVKISDKILNNANYKDLFKVQFGTAPSGYGSGNLENGVSATFTKQQYGKYASPSYIFDGKVVSFPDVVCHVTGIPYALSKTGNDSINKWSGAGTADVVSWTGNDGMVVGGIAGSHTIQKSFHIPSDIYVAVSTTGNVNSKLTGTVTVGGTQVVSKTGTSYIKSTSFEGSKVLQFKSSNSVAQVNLSSTLLTGVTMKVKTLSITYTIKPNNQ